MLGDAEEAEPRLVAAVTSPVTALPPLIVLYVGWCVLPVR